MEFIKLINVLACVIIYTSQQLWTVNSISLVSGPEDARALLGTDVIFTCEVDVSLYSIRWWFRVIDGDWVIISVNYGIINQEHPEQYSIVHDSSDSYDLKILNVQLTNAGDYECTYGYDSYSFTPNPALATLTVLQPPSESSPICSLTRNAIQVTSETFYVGESIIFHCSSEGHGYTSPNLNITQSDVDIAEYESEDIFDKKQVESDELIIEKIDTKFKCYLESEALNQSKICEIKPMVLLPAVEIEPRSASVLQSTDISFQCSGSSFIKTDDLHYEWQISPDVPGEVVTFTSSILKITSLGQNMTHVDSVFIVTCFIRDGQMEWNSSSTLSISLLTNNITNNGSGTSVTTISIVVAIVVIAIILVFAFFLWRRRKIRDKKSCEGNSNTGTLVSEQPYSAVQSKEVNADDQYSENNSQMNSSVGKTETNTPQCLNISSSETAVYYSTVPAENNQDDSNYDNIGHNQEIIENEPLYENKGFTPDTTELNVEGLTYADLDLEISASRDIIDTGPTNTYATVDMETR